MAVRTPRNQRKPGRGKRPKAFPPASSVKAAAPAETGLPSEGRGDPIPQKALVYAVRSTEPPAISDEAPEEMPFPTREP